MLSVDYVTWELNLDVIFNVSTPVNGWIELRITELGLQHRQRISLDINSTVVHIATTLTQVDDTL